MLKMASKNEIWVDRTNSLPYHTIENMVLASRPWSFGSGNYGHGNGEAKYFWDWGSIMQVTQAAGFHQMGFTGIEEPNTFKLHFVPSVPRLFWEIVKKLNLPAFAFENVGQI